LLPSGALEAAWAAIAQADLVLVVGTSGMVHPAADMPMDAHDRGIRVIEVNPQPSALTAIADVWIGQPSGEALPGLVRAATEQA
jgi:NAD-dependent deacetylase